MFKLSMKDSGAFLGTVDGVDLQLLIDQLEEEHENDKDYFVCDDTIEMLKESGASAALLKLLTTAVGNSDGVEVVWQKA
jgi:hypothetical protein